MTTTTIHHDVVIVGTGFSLMLQGNGAVNDLLAHIGLRSLQADWLADPDQPKALHDAKGPMHALAARGLELGGVDAPGVRPPDQLHLTPGSRPRPSELHIPSIRCSGRCSTSSYTGTTGVRIESTTVMARGW